MGLHELDFLVRAHFQTSASFLQQTTSGQPWSITPPVQVARISHLWVVHGSPQEEIDPNDPPPKGKPVHLSSFANANLMHDVVTGRSTSGVLEFINQIPIDWFSK